MSDVRTIAAKIDRLLEKGSDRLDAQAINMLLGKVRTHVQTLAEEAVEIKKKYELEKAARKKPESPEDEREIEEAKAALLKIKDLERQSSDRRRELRALEKDVQVLLSEIRKAA